MNSAITLMTSHNAINHVGRTTEGSGPFMVFGHGPLTMNSADIPKLYHRNTEGTAGHCIERETPSHRGSVEDPSNIWRDSRGTVLFPL
jgi:hypothetical protein